MNIVTVRFVWEGSGPEYAIKVVSDMFGIGLEEAKNAVENPAGVQMYDRQVYLLEELSYLSIQAHEEKPLYMGGEGSSWHIEYCEPLEPTKLV